MTKTIPLSKGYVALVDDEDYERVARWSWAYRVGRGNKGYAVRSTRATDTEHPGVLSMHRFIIGAPEGIGVDHKNGNTLDNRRDNLRLATNGQNQHNTPKYTRHGLPCSSRYKGVSWNQRRGKWTSRIALDKRLIWIGAFDNEIDAARAYDAAARELHGEFAQLNFPGERIDRGHQKSRPCH